MRQILDLHIHSKYSRACSQALELKNIDTACRQKGVDIVATGDFTHPAWFRSIKNELVEIGASGLYRLKSAPDDKIKFILSTELSLIYKQGDKVRRIHIMVQAPNLAAAAELNKFLGKKYNISSDGRPILGLRAPDLVKLCLSIHPHFLIYPAHIWTPWFSVFGSKSGFDTMAECFGSQTEHIYAIETGLSSDPEMNWRLSKLDRFTILSNSDAHSLPNIGREANIMDLAEGSYEEIYQIIKNKDLSKLKGTIEFYPEEGMYHYDGHRACGLRLTPAQTRKYKGLCPVCQKPLTVGVMYRVEELADRPVGFKPANSAPFVKLVELDKIIAESLGIKSRSAKRVQAEYQRLLQGLGPELYILLDAPLEEIAAVSGPTITEGVRRVRAGELSVEPGYDGVYGTIKIFSEPKMPLKQKSLFA